MIKPSTRRIIPHLILSGAIAATIPFLFFVQKTTVWQLYPIIIPVSFLVLVAAARAGEFAIRHLMESLELRAGEIFLRQGILTVEASRMQLAYVKNIKVTQSFCQRLFGVGNLTFYTTATPANPENEVVFKEVSNPYDAQEQIWAAMTGAIPKVEVVPKRSLRAISPAVP